MDVQERRAADAVGSAAERRDPEPTRVADMECVDAQHRATVLLAEDCFVEGCQSVDRIGELDLQCYSEPADGCNQTELALANSGGRQHCRMATVVMVAYRPRAVGGDDPGSCCVTATAFLSAADTCDSNGHRESPAVAVLLPLSPCPPF